jgi:rfaE bifunctional protein nucleotidyltransferase chain/domain
MHNDPKKKVYIYGVFDLLHWGHVQQLRKAKELGDHLTVGVFTDDFAAGYKRRPIIPQDQRFEMIKALEFVDDVVYQDEMAPDKILRELRPHVIAKGPGAGWTDDASPCEDIAKEIGAQTIVLPYHQGVSTSDIIKRIWSTHRPAGSGTIVASNHLLAQGLGFPQGAVMRLNLAWMPSKEAARETLASLVDHEVYLDYPQGRSKPPKPVITLMEAIELANEFPNVKFFAVSNVEDPHTLTDLKQRLPEHIQLVPKIETLKGVENLEAIITESGVEHVMLDKEDLYIDIERDGDEFNRLVDVARAKAKKLGFELLELQGVVFAPYR